MERTPLPGAVLAFVDEHIESVPQLEALILLRTSAPRAWEPVEVAARIYVSEAEAGRLLASLARQRIAALAGTTYAFDAQGPHVAVIDDVATAYRTHLVQIARAIHTKAAPGVREFARAFDIKKDR
jgi:hypothetical protein